MRNLSRIVAALLGVLLLYTSGAPLAFSQSDSRSDVRLALVIVVDQMRPDYLSRFDSVFTGGFARLAHEGFVFTNAHHDHAHTETGVGHATIATGAFPLHHGIVGNNWYDAATGKSVYCAGDSTAGITGHSDMEGRSPVNLRCSGISDWMNRGTPESKVYSLAIKDRAAIMMGGYSADGAYWYNSKDGTFITSSFYTAAYPQWVADFAALRPAEEYYSGVWDLLLPKSAYRFSGADQDKFESDGKDVTFPHIFSPRPDQKPTAYFDNLLGTPFAEHLIFRFAREIVLNDSLGQDDVVDLLMLGCSIGDYIGHSYGPQSWEVEDYYLRLDQYLGEFFALLDSTVGVGKYSVALSSDHGALEIPENLRAQGVDAGRIHPDTLKAAVKAAGDAASKALGLSKTVVIRSNATGCYLDYTEAQNKGLSPSEVQQALAKELRKIPYISDVYLTDEMSASGGSPRAYLQRFRNNFFEGRSAPISFRLKERYLIDSTPFGTTHGSCYEYDTHVPIVFFGPGIKAGSSDLSVHTVDIAPTLADLLKLQFISEPDGQSLLPLIKK